MKNTKHKAGSALAPLTGYAAAQIQAERSRQRRKWGLRHDDRHTDKAIARNARDVLQSYLNTIYHPDPTSDLWGLGRKHHDDLEKLLVVAGALVQAELERLYRQRRKAA